MRRISRSIERSAEAGLCFAAGVVISIAGWLGVQASAATVAVEPSPVPVPVAAPAPVRAPQPEPAPSPERGDPGDELGSFRLTRYYVVDEPAAPPTRRRGGDDAVLASTSGDTVTIYDDRGCKAIASLSRAFVRELDMEGTGRLRDGRTINVSKDCGCARSPCYRTTGGEARWGLSARGEPLEPFRSVAVDPDVIPLGTRLYIAELDGLTMPGPAPWGGFVHDGCVIATDVGGRIAGRHIDFFVGRHVHRKAFDARYQLERVTVHDAGDRCGERGPERSGHRF